ncbi:MAG: PD40 domain-containing protein [Gemmatimonadota bacterium]|nr:MAG: PD40 domain-containing protein [Gemmatimonadota bacterium]
MRHLNLLTVVSLSALVAACAGEPQGPDELEVADTLQTRGTLLTSGEPVESYSKLVWVPRTELVAFTSSSRTGGCAIKTVDATSGSTGVVDGDCVSIYQLMEPYFRRLVTAPDGSALYYTVGLNEYTGSPGSEFGLRVGDPDDGGASALRSVRWDAPLAVSPNGRRLAYVARRASQEGHSLIVRDLAGGAETYHVDFHEDTTFSEGPILFSPDGSELLYEVRVRSTLRRIRHRLSLDHGGDEVVSLPSGAHAQQFRWGASGIEVLVELGSPAEFHVQKCKAEEVGDNFDS